LRYFRRLIACSTQLARDVLLKGFAQVFESVGGQESSPEVLAKPSQCEIRATAGRYEETLFQLKAALRVVVLWKRTGNAVEGTPVAHGMEQASFGTHLFTEVAFELFTGQQFNHDTVNPG
jgi:hypothetical protein